MEESYQAYFSDRFDKYYRTSFDYHNTYNDVNDKNEVNENKRKFRASIIRKIQEQIGEYNEDLVIDEKVEQILFSPSNTLQYKFTVRYDVNHLYQSLGTMFPPSDWFQKMFGLPRSMDGFLRF